MLSTVTSQSSTETTEETEIVTGIEINSSQSPSARTSSASVTKPVTTNPSSIQTSTQQVTLTSPTTSATETGKYLIAYY